MTALEDNLNGKSVKIVKLSCWLACSLFYFPMFRHRCTCHFQFWTRDILYDTLQCWSTFTNIIHNHLLLKYYRLSPVIFPQLMVGEVVRKWSRVYFYLSFPKRILVSLLISAYFYVFLRTCKKFPKCCSHTSNNV